MQTRTDQTDVLVYRQTDGLRCAYAHMHSHASTKQVRSKVRKNGEKKHGDLYNIHTYVRTLTRASDWMDGRSDKTYDRAHACSNLDSRIRVHTHTHTQRGATGLIGSYVDGWLHCK